MSSIKDDFITKIIKNEIRNRKDENDTKGLLKFVYN